MKKLVVLFLFLLNVSAIYAQEIKNDIIIKNDGTKLETIISEVDVDVVRYKSSDNPSGPTYTIRKSEIASILYANGTTEVFQQQTPQNNLTYPNNLATLDQLNSAKNSRVAGIALLTTGSTVMFTGLMVGLFANWVVGLCIMMPIGAALIIPGAIMYSSGNNKIQAIQNNQMTSLYDIPIGKNYKHPVALSLHSNGLSLNF